MQEGLVLLALANILVFVVFTLVGVRFLRRTTEPEHREVIVAFASWWLLFAAQALLSVVRTTLTVAGILGPDGHEFVFQVENVVSVAALWGLGVYVLYLYRGSRRGSVVWTVYLCALAVLYVFVVAYHDIVRVEIEAWRTNPVFRFPISDAERMALVLSYYLTLLILAAAFFVLARRSDDRTVRSRAFAVGGGVTLLAVVGAVRLGPSSESPWSPMLTMMQVVAALWVWLAYFPPGSIRATYRSRH